MFGHSKWKTILKFNNNSKFLVHLIIYTCAKIYMPCLVWPMCTLYEKLLCCINIPIVIMLLTSNEKRKKGSRWQWTNNTNEFLYKIPLWYYCKKQAYRDLQLKVNQFLCIAMPKDKFNQIYIHYMPCFYI